MKEDIIDVEYNDINEDGFTTNVYHTIGYVAKELGVATSTIRHWSNKHFDLLDVELCNSHRRFSDLDIEKLKVIQQCVKNKMSHGQIEHTLKNTNFDIDNLSLKETKPLDVQVFMSALTVELENKMIAKQQELINQLIEANQKAIEEIRSEVATTVDEVVSERLDERLETHHKALQEDLKVQSENILQNQIKGITGHFEGIIKQHNNDIVERDIKITNQLHEVLALRKKEIMEKELEHQESKGFFKRLFGK